MSAAIVRELAGLMVAAIDGARRHGAEHVERALDRCAAAEGRDWRGWRQRRRMGELADVDAGTMARTLERVWKANEQ